MYGWKWSHISSLVSLQCSGALQVLTSGIWISHAKEKNEWALWKSMNWRMRMRHTETDNSLAGAHGDHRNWTAVYVNVWLNTETPDLGKDSAQQAKLKEQSPEGHSVKILSFFLLFSKRMFRYFHDFMAWMSPLNPTLRPDYHWKDG